MGLLCCFSFQISHAATFVSVAGGGLWSAGSTWTNSAVPTAADDVVINSAAATPVQVDANVSCASLTVNSSCGISIGNSSTARTLTISGNLTNNGTLGNTLGSGNNNLLIFNGTSTWSGSSTGVNTEKLGFNVNANCTLTLACNVSLKTGTANAPVTINGTLNAGNFFVGQASGGPAGFTLAPGGALECANANGLVNAQLGCIRYSTTASIALSTSANYIFDGTAAQVTTGLPAAVNNLTISNSTGVTLTGAVTVSGVCALNSGRLATSPANLLTLAASGNITGGSANSFVSGPLAKVFNSTVSQNFPIGTNSNYRAVVVNMTALATNPSTITVTPREPSAFGGTAPGGATLFATRSWTVASSASSGNVCTLTVDATGFSPAGAGVLYAFNGTTTIPCLTTTPTATNYQTAGVNLTASSDFALGDCVAPSTAPTNVIASAQACGPVSVIWDSIGGAASYSVYRKFSGGIYGPAIGNSATTNFSDPSAINGSNYVYAVSAISPCGGEGVKSSDSGPVSPTSAAFFISSPSSISASNTFTATFTATSINANSNQWFLSTNGGGVWKKVATGTGGTAAIYTTTAVNTNMTGYQYASVAYGCSGSVTSAPATLTVIPYTPPDQYDLLRLAWLSNLLSNASSASSVASTATKYWTGSNPINTSPSGGSFYLWSDLPLGSVSANMRDTFQRLQSMALAYAMPSCSLYTNAALANVIANGLDWMNTNVYTKTATSFYDNWFHWEISGAQAFDNTVVELYPFLNTTQISNYCAAIDNFGPNSAKMINATFGWPQLTGANLSSVVLVGIVRGALGKSSGKIVEAQTNLSRTFPYVTGGDGFYSDGSYVFHGNVAYNGQYGLVQLETIGNLVNLLHNSPWEVTDPGVNNVYAWASYLEPFIYNGALMDMIRGRDLTTSEFTAGAQAISDIRLVAGFATDTNVAASLNAFASSPRLASGQFHYFNMDRVVAMRSGFGFGLSMSSTRIANYENETVVPSAANNLKGWDTGDGMTYLYVGNTDNNFTGDYWATVDYYHLPGTTSQTNWKALPNTVDQNWVGGAHVASTYGVAGMSLHPIGTNGNYSTLVGKKSWFMLDNEIVCLGAGINCNENNPIDTTLENRRLGASPTNHFWVNGADIPPTIGWSSNLTSATWCALDGVGGYYFPGGATNLQATFTSSSGKWTDIHPTDSDTNLYTDNYLKLYFKHGVKPTNSTYAYVLLPNMSATSVSNYANAPGIIVLTNTPTVQAVSKPSLGVVAANFWTDGNNSAGFISSSNKASVITLQTSNTISVGVSDPTQTNGNSITVTLNQAAASVLSADAGVTVLQLAPKIILSVNGSLSQGQTIQASFVTTSTSVNTNPPVFTSFGMTGFSSGQFQMQFTGYSNSNYSVLGTTNLALSLTNWMLLGSAAQLSNGVFQFTDNSVTNNAQRFYRLRSP